MIGDAHFQGRKLLDGVDINITRSPCGPIRVSTMRGRYRVNRGSAVLLATDWCVVEWDVTSYRGTHANLGAASYAVVPKDGYISGTGLVIHTPEYIGYPQIGGPVEAMGRLKYIDGCSDTLLVCPAIYGEPCLNHLHLPAGIHQTEHVHPSDRIGIILAGTGECRTPDGAYALTAGMFWRIPEGGKHSFHTEAESLDVMAWHPDSEFGPKHDDHPMLSRTIIDGDSADSFRHEGIRTKEIRA